MDQESILPISILEDIKVFAAMRKDKNTPVSELEDKYEAIVEDIANRIQDAMLNSWLDGNRPQPTQVELVVIPYDIAPNTVDTFAMLASDPERISRESLLKFLKTGGLQK